jgi:hypothetical protein
MQVSADGSRVAVTTSDGTVTTRTQNADDSTTTEITDVEGNDVSSSAGSGAVNDDGSITTSSADGSSTTVSEDGRTVTTAAADGSTSWARLNDDGTATTAVVAAATPSSSGAVSDGSAGDDGSVVTREEAQTTTVDNQLHLTVQEKAASTAVAGSQANNSPSGIERMHHFRHGAMVVFVLGGVAIAIAAVHLRRRFSIRGGSTSLVLQGSHTSTMGMTMALTPGNEVADAMRLAVDL